MPFTVTRPRRSTAEGIGAVVAEELLDSSAGGGISVLYRLAILVRLGGDVAGLEVGVPTLDVPVRLLPSTAELTVGLTNETLQPARVTVAFTATGELRARTTSPDPQTRQQPASPVGAGLS